MKAYQALHWRIALSILSAIVAFILGFVIFERVFNTVYFKWVLRAYPNQSSSMAGFEFFVIGQYVAAGCAIVALIVAFIASKPSENPKCH